MFLFWKLVAWIAFGWSLIARRGKGILILKKKPNGDGNGDPGPPAAREGPGWRLVSSSSHYPGRNQDPGLEDPDTDLTGRGSEPQETANHGAAEQGAAEQSEVKGEDRADPE